MALIYEHIYQSKNFTKIDLSQYLELLVDKICYNYNFKKNFNKKIELQYITISLDIAMPIALITNELLSNIFIHAFKNIENPYLEIILKKTKKNIYSLNIKSNGIGLLDNIDSYSDKNFSFMLVNLLVKQINGKMLIKKEKGTQIIINFFDNLYYKK